MVYTLLRRVLPPRAATITTALIYAVLAATIFLMWETHQAGFRYEEL
jgi:hypothetical protein